MLQKLAAPNPLDGFTRTMTESACKKAEELDEMNSTAGNLALFTTNYFRLVNDKEDQAKNDGNIKFFKLGQTVIYGDEKLAAEEANLRSRKINVSEIDIELSKKTVQEIRIALAAAIENYDIVNAGRIKFTEIYAVQKYF